MTALGSTLVAKKKTPQENNGNKDERVAVIVLKGSQDYRDWLNSISKDSLIPVASIVRDALSKWAAQRGYNAPPEL